MKTFRLRPSAAASWIACHGAAYMRSLYPEESGVAAEEGTAGHWVAACLLTGQPVAVGYVAPNGIAVTDAMVRGATLYYNEVKSWQLPVYVETLIDCPDIHPECGGTPDVFAIDWDQQHIYLADYKFGFQVVDVYQNWQLLCYLSGIRTLMFKRTGLHPITSMWTVTFVVIQPRAGHPEGQVRYWTVTMQWLTSMFDRLQLAARFAMMPEPSVKTGSQCRYCTARHACEANQLSAHVAVEMSGMSTAHELTTPQASRELFQLEEASKIIESRISGLTAQIEHALLHKGESATMHTIGRSRSREVWRAGTEEEVIAIGKMSHVDLAKPRQAVTPAEARRQGVNEDLIKRYSVKPDGAAKLVRIDYSATAKQFEKATK